MEPSRIHDMTGVVKDIVEIIGFSAAAMYFVWRVFFQRMFQRLSVDIGLTPLGPSNGVQPRQVAVECKIENKAEVRIELEWLKYRLVWGGEPTCGDFPGNMSRHAAASYHAIDADASSRFVAEAEIPANTHVVIVIVEFRPRLTDNTYTFQKAVTLV
ncbi:hypothetical protein [Paludisphaera rhizosphaerae]|uniref:hypothetical protein n=1 Tax=Paludisphaera rhizosphaerae TaxID=2711216 RepID=UPI0013EAFB9B|nr:hypothetical protein [Paludisphaera rhizosphaerae]